MSRQPPIPRHVRLLCNLGACEGAVIFACRYATMQEAVSACQQWCWIEWLILRQIACSAGSYGDVWVARSALAGVIYGSFAITQTLKSRYRVAELEFEEKYYRSLSQCTINRYDLRRYLPAPRV